MARPSTLPRTRGPCNFRQRDMMAAVKAVVAAGCQVHRVEVDPSGKIVVVTTQGAPTSSEPAHIPDGAERNEWDE